MERRNGKDHCRMCGGELAFPQGATIRAVFIGASSRPRARAIQADGKQIHRCEIAGAAQTEPLPEFG